MLAKADVMKAVNKKRTERIIPLEPIQTEDGRGGRKTVMTPRTPLMALFRKPSLRTEVVAGAVASVMQREIEVMFNSDIKKGWQVMHGTKKYDVEHVYSYGRETTILVCKDVDK